MDQHGVVARQQLLTGGVWETGRSSSAWRESACIPVHAGYTRWDIGCSPPGDDGWRRCSPRAPDAVLSHRTAGQLWDILPSRSPISKSPDRAPLAKRRHIRAHRSSLAADERMVARRHPRHVRFSRTIFDLGRHSGSVRARAGDQRGEVRELTDRLSVPDLLARHPRPTRDAEVAGCLCVTWAADGGITANDVRGRFRSAGRCLIGCRCPRFNADIAVRGRFFKVDAMWEAQKVIVELDGRAAHGTRSAFESDRERDRLLLLAGWRVVRITWRQLRDTPEVIAADLRELLERPATSTLRA